MPGRRVCSGCRQLSRRQSPAGWSAASSQRTWRSRAHRLRGATGNVLAVVRSDHGHQYPTHTEHRRPYRRRTNSLIDWIEPERNMRVLDWRERAQQFGLVPVGAEEDRAAAVVSTSPERLLQEEEPEALADQPVLERPGDDEEEETDSGRGAAEAPEEVRGRARLARRCRSRAHVPQPARQTAAPDLHAGTGNRAADRGAPCRPAHGACRAARARSSTIAALPKTSARGLAPAAELVLLPDGGELTPDKAAPTLEAFRRMRRLERCMARWRRSEAHDAATRDAHVARAQETIAASLRDLPIRPALIEEVRSGAAAHGGAARRARRARRRRRKRDGGARRSSKTGSASRPRRSAGEWPRWRKRRRRSSTPSASCSRRTCGWSCRLRGAT